MQQSIPLQKERAMQFVPVLEVPQQLWEDFREAMLDARRDDGKVRGVLFCDRHVVGTEEHYHAQAWYVPSRDDYVFWSGKKCRLKDHVHFEFLEHVIYQGLHLVQVHLHTGRGPVAFSAAEDRYEAQYATALRCLPGRPRLLSGVFDHNLTADTGVFRLWVGDTPYPVRFGLVEAPSLEVGRDYTEVGDHLIGHHQCPNPRPLPAEVMESTGIVPGEWLVKVVASAAGEQVVWHDEPSDNVWVRIVTWPADCDCDRGFKTGQVVRLSQLDE